MKNLLFSLMALALLMTACKKDDKCDDSTLNTAIIGTWDVIVLGLNAGSVEFKGDGSLIDEEDNLIGGEIGGEVLDHKSYEVVSEELIVVEAANASGTASIELEINVDEYDCDEISGDSGGLPVTLKKD